MPRKISTKGLKKKAWDTISRWVRLSYSDENGMVKCVTCPEKSEKIHWKKSQGGHFVNGRGNSILFEEKNIHPQCYACNVILRGNWSEYYAFMKKTYGQREINRLLALKKKIVQFTHDDYQKLIDKYSIETGTQEWTK